MVIERQRYLDTLIRHKNNGLIKVITGIRRCGKSYLLFELFSRYLKEQGVPEDNIITVPLDDEAFADCCDPHKLNEYLKSRLVDERQNYYIFIDEAQYAITKEEMKNPDIPVKLSLKSLSERSHRLFLREGCLHHLRLDVQHDDHMASVPSGESDRRL